MNNALSAAQRRYDDMEPPTDDYDANVSRYIDKYARGLAESFVLYGETIPGLPELDLGELTAQSVWLRPKDCPESLWSRDIDGQPKKSLLGYVMVEIADVVVAHVRLESTGIFHAEKHAEKGLPVVNRERLRWFLIEAADQYIRNNAERVYDAWVESMEQGDE